MPTKKKTIQPVKIVDAKSVALRVIGLSILIIFVINKSILAAKDRVQAVDPAYFDFLATWLILLLWVVGVVVFIVHAAKSAKMQQEPDRWGLVVVLGGVIAAFI
jgi:hypothetical protein